MTWEWFEKAGAADSLGGVADRSTVVSPAETVLLGSSSFTDDGQERTVTDLNATDPRKFYHVEITKP